MSPGFGGWRWETAGANAALSRGTTLTAPGSVNTKAAWTELVAATAHDAGWVEVRIVFPQGAFALRALVDIGIGGVGSELVLIPDLHVASVGAASFGGVRFLFPLRVPAGSRLVARYQGSSTSAPNVFVSIALGSTGLGSIAPCRRVATYGADTSDSGGTAVDPGAVAHTKSAWVELTAATEAESRWVVLTVGHNAAALSGSIRWLVDLGIGAAGAERVLIEHLFLMGGSSYDTPLPAASSLPLLVPAGSRVAVRAQCMSTNATDRVIDLVASLAG